MNPFRKGLTFVVISLFIGLVFLPSVNSEIPNEENYVNNEDCNCRQTIKPNIVLLKRLIKRVKANEKLLSLLPRLNPEIEKKYKELSDSLTPFLDIENKDTLGPIWDAFCERVESFEDRFFEFAMSILFYLEPYYGFTIAAGVAIMILVPFCMIDLVLGTLCFGFPGWVP